MSTVRIDALPAGTAYIRSLIALALGHTSAGAAQFADVFCKTTPEVRDFFQKGGFVEHSARHQEHVRAIGQGSLVGKAAVGPMTTAAESYAIGRDAFALLQSASIFGRLSQEFRRVPFRTLTPREFGAGAGGAWRGEGLPRPIMQTTADQLTQETYEASTVIVLTREVLRFGSQNEAFLRLAVAQGLAKWIDGQLLDPSVTAVAGVKPAAITNGAAAVTSTGSTAAQIIADLASLIAAITSPGDSLRWVMRPRTLAFINVKLAGVGYPTMPGYLCGIPVIAGSTSPQQITLVDAKSIAVSHDDVVDSGVNLTSDVEMESAPNQNGLTGTGAQMVSMFQTQCAALQASMCVAWQPAEVNAASPAQASGVAYMTVTY
jgi:hypothetical protein